MAKEAAKEVDRMVKKVEKLESKKADREAEEAEKGKKRRRRPVDSELDEPWPTEPDSPQLYLLLTIHAITKAVTMNVTRADKTLKNLVKLWVSLHRVYAQYPCFKESDGEQWLDKETLLMLGK
jgi:hypothetical protein